MRPRELSGSGGGRRTGPVKDWPSWCSAVQRGVMARVAALRRLAELVLGGPKGATARVAALRRVAELVLGGPRGATARVAALRRVAELVLGGPKGGDGTGCRAPTSGRAGARRSKGGDGTGCRAPTIGRAGARRSKGGDGTGCRTPTIGRAGARRSKARRQRKSSARCAELVNPCRVSGVPQRSVGARRRTRVSANSSRCAPRPSGSCRAPGGTPTSRRGWRSSRPASVARWPR